MPSPWLALLKSVPWIDVIRNATTVAEGARKLWNTVRKQSPVPETQDAVPELALPTDLHGLTRIQSRLAGMERTVAALQGEMLASSELIKNLAEQNTQLVARIEASRVRSVWLATATVVLGAIAVVALVLGLAR
jgi:cytochrome c-type biogenesis protein CcmH/NrfG